MRRLRPPPRAAAVVAAPPRAAKERSPAEVDRALAELAEAVNRGTEAAAGAGFVEVDLIVGRNVVAHGLGRTPIRVDVMPKTAAVAFGWGFDWTQPGNPHPDRQAWIDVIGAPVTARVFFF